MSGTDAVLHDVAQRDYADTHGLNVVEELAEETAPHARVSDTTYLTKCPQSEPVIAFTPALEGQLSPASVNFAYRERPAFQ